MHLRCRGRCDGTDVERLLDRALADRFTDYVTIHTARPGCLLCRVERPDRVYLGIPEHPPIARPEKERRVMFLP